MEGILAFLIEHWMLSCALGVIIVLLLLNEWRLRSGAVKGISSAQLVDLLNHSDATVVDIRVNERYAAGHILGAINFPRQDLETRLNALNKYKTKTIILVCATGIDSPKMGQLLITHGFTNLYYLLGGMGAWQSNGLPIVNK